MSASHRLCARILLLVALFCSARPATRAVILFGTEGNTTPPTDELAESGWQYQGDWGGFLGTPIAPNFFVSAAHIGQQSSVFRFNGVDYPVSRSYVLRLGVNSEGEPLFSDLVIWKVDAQFPFFAPLYSNADEAGKRLVVIGRGTERGDPISHFYNGQTTDRGWGWGDGLATRRWGENIVSDIVAMGPANNDGIYALFEQGGLPFEAHLSNGDSGGAVFIKEAGAWKLAGINYAVDGHFYPGAGPTGEFDAALYDARGFYYRSAGQYFQVTGDTPVPTGFYASRISSRLDWIYSVTDPRGDLEGDSLPNLLEHAMKLHPLVPDAAQLPGVTREGDFLVLTYRKNVAQGDLVYAVEKSADLASWATVETQDETSPAGADLEIVRAKVAIGSASQLFLRLRITRP